MRPLLRVGAALVAAGGGLAPFGARAASVTAALVAAGSLLAPSAARAARATAALVAASGLLAPSAARAAPRVTLAVIGPAGEVLRAPRATRASAAVLRIDGRRCRVAQATPLAALMGARLPVRARGDGACSPSAYFVWAIGRRANAGRNGWAYKVGRRAGTASAADPSGSFGNGRALASGQVVTWFWCVLGSRGCQRTLVARRIGASRVRVTGYDDAGRGRRIRRALVTATDRRGHRVRGRTDRRGELRLRGVLGPLRITARRRGMVPALPGGTR